MKIEFWKGDRKIATVDHYSCYRLYRSVPDPSDDTKVKPEPIMWPGMKHLSLLHFRRLNMEPPVLFEHLSGVGLSGFLDHCDIRADEQFKHLEAKDLRYIHGRSEVMRGTPAVSAVVLAKIDPADDFEEIRFRTQMPEIYRTLLQQMTSPTAHAEGT